MMNCKKSRLENSRYCSILSLSRSMAYLYGDRAGKCHVECKAQREFDNLRNKMFKKNYFFPFLELTMNFITINDFITVKTLF